MSNEQQETTYCIRKMAQPINHYMAASYRRCQCVNTPEVDWLSRHTLGEKNVWFFCARAPVVLQDNLNPGKVLADVISLVLHYMKMSSEKCSWLTDKIGVARSAEMITLPCPTNAVNFVVPRVTVGENWNAQDSLTKVICGLVVVPVIFKNLKVYKLKFGSAT